MPSAAARSSVSCLEPAIVSAGSDAMAATAPRAAIGVAPRAQRLERALAAAHGDVAGPERRDDAVGVGVEGRARIGQDDARLGRARAHAAGALLGGGDGDALAEQVQPARDLEAGARIPVEHEHAPARCGSHVPPVLQAAPRHGADPVERQALEAVEAPARAGRREVRLAHQPVDVVDLAGAQVLARVEADVERDARDVAGMIEPVRPARRDEAGAAGIELQRLLLGVVA